MKFLKTPFVLLALSALVIVACKKDKQEDEDGLTGYKIDQAYSLSDISYGSDGEQNMDIYLPQNRNSATTKVFVLVHGGGWSGGDKADFDQTFNSLKSLYPNHAIINLNYRLGTVASPGYPKQINDIQAALNEIQLPKYNLSKNYFFIGSSAGAHLSTLYSYAFDGNGYVKGIGNIVGPTDLTDPAYTDNPAYNYILAALVGPYTYAQNPQLYEDVSPALHVKSSSAKTISFYGDADPLIPNSQMSLLHDELTNKGVLNSFTMYSGGHGGWSEADNTDCFMKLFAFINEHFNY